MFLFRIITCKHALAVASVVRSRTTFTRFWRIIIGSFAFDVFIKRISERERDNASAVYIVRESAMDFAYIARLVDTMPYRMVYIGCHSKRTYISYTSTNNFMKLVKNKEYRCKRDRAYKLQSMRCMSAFANE